MSLHFDTPVPSRASQPTHAHVGSPGPIITMENSGNTSTNVRSGGDRERGGESSPTKAALTRALMEANQRMADMSVMMERLTTSRPNPTLATDTDRVTPGQPLSSGRLRFSMGQVQATPNARPREFVDPTPFVPFSSPQRASALPVVSPVVGVDAPPAPVVSSHAVSGGAMRPKIDMPEKFKGSPKDRSRCREWLRQVDDYMNLTALGQSDAFHVMLFGQLLGDSAQTWFQGRREREGSVWTLQSLYDEFLIAYSGQATQTLWESSLDTMRWNRRKDVTAFAAEWEAIIMRLYPQEWAGGVGVDGSVLFGKMFSVKILEGDDEVWREAKRSRPHTLIEWKVAVQEAVTLLEQLKSVANRRRVSPVTATQVNNIHGTDDGSSEREEGEPEELNQVQASSKTRGGQSGNVKRVPKKLLYTAEEFEKVKAKQLCFYCGQPGHAISDCADRKAGKPKTKATAAVLNA